MPLRPDSVERAVKPPRPSIHEISTLLVEYRQMLAEASGWASRIPRERLTLWEARKQELLTRIERHTARQTSRDLAREIDQDGPER